MASKNIIRKFFFGENIESRRAKVSDYKNNRLNWSPNVLRKTRNSNNLASVGLPPKYRFAFKQKNWTLQQINNEKIKLRLVALEYILHGMIELFDLNRLYLKKLVKLNNGKLTKIEKKKINIILKSSEKYFESGARARHTDKKLYCGE